MGANVEIFNPPPKVVTWMGEVSPSLRSKPGREPAPDLFRGYPLCGDTPQRPDFFYIYAYKQINA